VNFKTALLRDLCRALGIQVVLDPSRKLLLGNKIKPIVACLNEAIQQEAAAAALKQKKRLAQPAALTEQAVLSDYKYLPFQAKDIGKLYAKVKQIKHPHNEVRACLGQANQFHKEGQLDRAYELYS